MIVVVPELSPLTTPAALIEATTGLLLLQVPLPAASLRLLVPPIHNTVVPVMGGTDVTVTTVAALQPAAVVKLMVVVPPVMPATMPVPSPIVATVVLLLVQVPAPEGSVSVVVVPAHMEVVPELGASAFTVMVVVR